jgi:hypothetical protein
VFSEGTEFRRDDRDAGKRIKGMRDARHDNKQREREKEREERNKAWRVRKQGDAHDTINRQTL